MKLTLNAPALGFALLLTCSLLACTATPVKPGGFQGEYNKPLKVVKQAGIDAMAVNGFEVTQNDPAYIEGHRPRTWGFFCTPGGGRSGHLVRRNQPISHSSENQQ